MRTRTHVSLVLAGVLLGCGNPTSQPEDRTGIIVPDGKADDFLSLSATEFVVSGRATVTLEAEFADASEEERTARLRELVGYQQVAIAWFLNQYLIDKKDGDANEEYGGFGSMARANTYDSLDLQTDDGVTYSFYFEQLVAGQPDLISALPTTSGDDGERHFDLEIGTPSNDELAQLETNDEWYRRSPWSPWNPATVDASRKTTLDLAIRVEEASNDAWFDYVALMEDDVLDIAVHFGWDYHAAYHVTHARSLYGWLERNGFTSPVDGFDALDRTSGPLTRTIVAGGREVRVEVSIFYGADDTDTDPDTAAGGVNLENDMRASLATRDVIMYSGHSGPFYGFALANWRMTDEGDLDDSEMRTVEMPERYQLVVAEGCDTYQIGEAFRNNPAKPGGRNIDTITTTAPSNASTSAAVQDVIAHLIRTNADGDHDPKPIRALLRDLDSNTSWFHTMYGVHGIDDNPQLHPWAYDVSCVECQLDSDCGGPGNRCVGVEGGSVCMPACTTDAACGEGACRPLADSSSREIYDAVCVPSACF